MSWSIFVGLAVLALTALLVWRINRGRKTGLAKRWPPTFAVTLLGSFFGVVLVIFSLGLPKETASSTGEVFAFVWALYLVAGLVGCFAAWTHSGRVERKAFRESLTKGIPAPLPIISAQRLSLCVGVLCFLAMFVIVVAVAGTTGPDTSRAQDPLENIVIIGTCVTGIAATTTWWIQHRRVARRDEDYRKAQEYQLERLAQENSAAYRNGFDDGQTAAP